MRAGVQQRHAQLLEKLAYGKPDEDFVRTADQLPCLTYHDGTDCRQSCICT